MRELLREYGLITVAVVILFAAVLYLELSEAGTNLYYCIQG